MKMNTTYLYLLSPLHTGGTTQEGNLVGIARESHTNFPYIPSSTIRGKLRSVSKQESRKQLFGPELEPGVEVTLTQGDIWIGDGSILWIPVPSLSHGVIWVSCPLLLKRWKRLQSDDVPAIPSEYSSNQKGPIYLKDAIIKNENLEDWSEWEDFVPSTEDNLIDKVLVLPDQHCATVIQMGLWRQVKIKLDESKSVHSGSFRYEEAIPPDTLMYFTWGFTSQSTQQETSEFENILNINQVLQIGGQESLGRGFVKVWQ
jgi:CRISPR-associated protein Cmr4